MYPAVWGAQQHNIPKWQSKRKTSTSDEPRLKLTALTQEYFSTRFKYVCFSRFYSYSVYLFLSISMYFNTHTNIQRNHIHKKLTSQNMNFKCVFFLCMCAECLKVCLCVCVSFWFMEMELYWSFTAAMVWSNNSVFFWSGRDYNHQRRNVLQSVLVVRCRPISVRHARSANTHLNIHIWIIVRVFVIYLYRLSFNDIKRKQILSDPNKYIV